MRRLVIVLSLAALLAACGAQAAPPGTGIQGVVEAGPTCPVERINSPCPPRPLAASILVRDAGGAEVMRFQSGADGHFKVELKPATYTLVGLPIGTGGLPRPIPVTVVVTAGAYSQVTIRYDSGIR